MFAPETVAFEFWGITIWHHDPCKDGSDDSCGWTRPKLTDKEIKFAEELIYNDFDNLRILFGEQQIQMVGDKAFFENCSRDDMVRNICCILRNYKRFQRKWWQHPKWHFWHWHIHIRCLNFRFGKKRRKSSLMGDISW